MRFDVKKPRNTDMVLQITSMADCFVIILVFLLKSLATGANSVTPSAGLRLPQALAGEMNEQAVTVEISQSGVQVDNKPVSALTAFRFNPADLAENGVSKALDSALDAQKKRQELIAQSNPDVKPDSKILVVADERTPYVTLKSVLAAAAIHGFSDFKLVVAKKD
jgi:biopolymer transport protein ExbD